MPGRLHQAANRFDAVMRRRMDQLAERVANGAKVTIAGRDMGLTAGQTARVWANIKVGLGVQAR
jgi:hypothetical protein